MDDDFFNAGLFVFVDMDIFFVAPDGVLRVGNGALDERVDSVRADLLGFNGAVVVVADRFRLGVLVNLQVLVEVVALVVVEDVIIMLFRLLAVVDEEWLFFVVAMAVVLLIRGAIFFFRLSSRAMTLVAKTKRPVLGAQEK